MTDMSNPAAAETLLEWGIAALTLPSETESGDSHVVAPFRDGALVAVVDGLGHGSEAAIAARAAITVLQRHAGEAAMPLVRRCHEELRRTRGAVLSIASFNGLNNTMTWLGVGNVEGMLFRASATALPQREAILLRGGVVGYQLPPLRETVLPVARGDTMIFVTDGIRDGFAEKSPIGRHTGNVADDILARFARHTDDALVLVARYLGRPP